MSDTTRNINTGKPFARSYEAYREHGWMGTIPLPAGQKHPPPVGWTGRNARHPEQDDIDAWLIKPKYKAANIGLHLGVTPDGAYEVIGIDVDNYGEKLGGQQLAALEAELGALPPTYISSSRPMPSGIRFYRVPAGFSFRGKAASAIEIIQKAHRYAVVWPSWNPDSDAQYAWWNPQGQIVSGLDDLPDVSELPVLEQGSPWFNFLTQDGMIDSGDDIDMELSISEIEAWARDEFRKAPSEDDEVCSKMQDAVLYWQSLIEVEESSHDKITGAHWNLIALGAEGHYDWSLAVAAVEQTYVENTLRRGKRSVGDVRNEVMRSRINAIRKLKAQIDSGKRGIALACTCYTENEVDFEIWQSALAENNPGLAMNATQRSEISAEKEVDRIKRDGMPNPVNLKDPGDYTLDDDGNAQHWLDMYSGHAHYIPEYGEWIMWNGVEWVQGDGIAVRSYMRVKERQANYARQLASQAVNLQRDQDPGAKGAIAIAKRWKSWVERSGMVGGKENALKMAASKAILHENELNNDPHLLGVANGVLRLNEDGSVSLNDMTKDHFITLNTGVEYIPWSELGMYEEDAQFWEDIVEQWIPDPELRAFVQKSIGYTLLGDNRDRLSFWLKGTTGTGKSTFLNTIMAALGDYAGPVDLSIFRGDRHTNPALVAALPRRIITASEASQSNVLHADVFKRITGGESIAAELKYSNEMINRVPCFTPWVATNSAPSMPGADVAVRRRVIVIPFAEQVAEDSKIGVRLRSARGVRMAALSWAVEGWRMYAASGMALNQLPVQVREANDSFASELSDLAMFVMDRIRKADFVPHRGEWSDEWKITSSEAFDEYENWCLDNRSSDRNKLTRRQFVTQLQDNGIDYRMVRLGKVPTRCFLGVQLKRLKAVKLEKGDG